MNLIGVEESKHEEFLAQTFKEIKFDEIHITLVEAREMVLKSDMLVVPGINLKQIFLLDQVRQ